MNVDFTPDKGDLYMANQPTNSQVVNGCIAALLAAFAISIDVVTLTYIITHW